MPSLCPLAFSHRTAHAHSITRNIPEEAADRVQGLSPHCCPPVDSFLSPTTCCFLFPTAAEAQRGQLCPRHVVLQQSSWPSSCSKVLASGRLVLHCHPNLPRIAKFHLLALPAALPVHRAFSYPHRGPLNVRVVSQAR